MVIVRAKNLALYSGPAVRTGKTWPIWPQYSSNALKSLEKVLESRRWAISGFWNGSDPLEFEFASRFTKFIGTKYCIPTDHGTSAILIALQALGISYGDEVIVPGLTWVSCASSILRANAIPVLVDIEKETQCLCPKALKRAITSRTAAILVVHLNGAMANMDEILHIAKQHNIAVIEDCAQAHGSEWENKKAGSLGLIGVFSMQQGKTLTCGEGGAAVTSDEYLYRKMIQLRNDGRLFSSDPFQIGHQQLEECGELIGANLAMSEFQVAVLLDGLDRLNDQNAIRSKNIRYLEEQLDKISGIKLISPYPKNNFRGYYHFSVRYEPEYFANRPVQKICQALEAELGFWIHPTYRPLNQHKLYRPHLDMRISFDEKLKNKIDPTQYSLPECIRQFETTILIHHSAMLGNKSDMDDIVEAFGKVQKYAYEID